MDLQEYQESYKARIEGFHRELRDLSDFEKKLKKNVDQIDSTLSEKESSRERAFFIKQEINQFKIKRDNMVANKEYINEKLAKIDTECEELTHQATTCEKKIAKLEKEKKNAAAAKKFKEASKAQSEIKEYS